MKYTPPLFSLLLIHLPQICLGGKIKWEPNPLRGVPQVFNGRNVTSTFGNPVRERLCFKCIGEMHPRFATILQRCSNLREIWNQYKGRKQFMGNSNGDRDKALDQLKKDYTEKCPYGIEDCFYVKPMDKRILGYEERGCGSGLGGKPVLPHAEPGEGCLVDKVMYSNRKLEVINCVCDNTNYCNGGGMNHWRKSVWIWHPVVIIMIRFWM